jgi:undecaprenyl diphosphate synthase
MAVLNHLACIMDGNRRWAQRQGKVPWYGHSQGIETVQKVIEFCLQKQIKYLSLYTFSLENFSRSAQENSFLFGLMLKEAQKGSATFKQHGIRLRFIGDRTLFPASLQPLLDNLEQETADCAVLIVNILFCYGGRQEITAAVKKIAQQVKNGDLQEDTITPELISSYLWTGHMPDPDLIIRTGGFSRLSNFLPYQSAYSEIQVLDCLWPDLTAAHLQNAYDSFMGCKRNFGA